MNLHRSLTLLTLLAAASLFAGERINHEGRILGPAPVVSAPTLFNTPEADAIVGAIQQRAAHREQSQRRNGDHRDAHGQRAQRSAERDAHPHAVLVAVAIVVLRVGDGTLSVRMPRNKTDVVVRESCR